MLQACTDSVRDILVLLLQDVFVTTIFPCDLTAHTSGPGLRRFIKGNSASSLTQNVIQARLCTSDGQLLCTRLSDIELRLADGKTCVHINVTRAHTTAHYDAMNYAPCVITFQYELPTLKMWLYAFGVRVEPCIDTRATFDLFAPSRVVYTHTTEAYAMYEPCVNSDHTLLAYIECDTLWLHELPTCRALRRFTTCGWGALPIRGRSVETQRLADIKGHLQGLCFTPEHTLLVSTPGYMYEISTDGHMLQTLRGTVMLAHGVSIDTHSRLCVAHSDVIAACGFYGGYTFARKPDKDGAAQRLSTDCFFGTGTMCVLPSKHIVRISAPDRINVFTSTGEFASSIDCMRAPAPDKAALNILFLTGACACAGNDLLVATTTQLYALEAAPVAAADAASEAAPPPMYVTSPILWEGNRHMTPAGCTAADKYVIQHVRIVHPRVYIFSAKGMHAHVTVIENVS
jgi:hypothetical protein